MDTLVLSTAYQPMRYIEWQEAFCLWFSGRVEVVEFYSDKFVHTVSEKLQVPSIVRFVKNVIKKNRQSKAARFNRINVLIRDSYQCQYCKCKLEHKNLTLDHVLPISQGGKTNWKNIVACCMNCNQKKKDRTPNQAGMKLLKEPYVPDNFELSNKLGKNRSIPEEWKDYL